MNGKRIGLWVAILGTVACLGATAKRQGTFVVHEWGTLLTMSGSDGVTLDGMYHEEHALPAFVHSRSKDQLHLHSAMVKGETPVIYFYSDIPRKVNVKVEFPGGLWTQWYPQASLVGPGLAQTGSPPQLKRGHIEWNASILPPGSNKAPAPPKTATDALWNYARDVDANSVVVTHNGREECDRFIFYRGLGGAAMPLKFSAAHGGTLSLRDASSAIPSDLDRTPTPNSPIVAEVTNLIVIRVENGKGVYRIVPSLSRGSEESGVIPSLDHALPLVEFAAKIGADLTNRLVEAGLYPKEAQAMVNTWTNSYFKTDGIRALYTLPQKWTDSFIPMTIVPSPSSTVRVMVGRAELLTPERERSVERAIRELGSSESGVRRIAFDRLREQGRYVEPVLRRVGLSSQDTSVRRLSRQLLMTGFVNELRSSLRSAADGGAVVARPLDVRAQLAATLREAGLDAEAKAEGRAVLNELNATKEPEMIDHLARFYLRQAARANEAIGDNEGSLAAYSKLIDFGSAAGKCGNDFCHSVEGPRNASYFRDWWAGRKYAEYARRNGQTEKLIITNLNVLSAKRDSRACQLKLAYLYESAGRSAEAADLWARIDPIGQKTKPSVAKLGAR